MIDHTYEINSSTQFAGTELDFALAGSEWLNALQCSVKVVDFEAGIFLVIPDVNRSLHGDYKLITLAPASVQEMYDFVKIAFDLAFKYRNPALILSDGAIGQMMEKVELDEQRPRFTDEEIRKNTPCHL